MKSLTLELAMIGLTAIGVTALVTGHDGVIIQSIISAICMVAGYAISKRKDNNNNGENVRRQAELMVLEWLITEKPTPEQVRDVIQKMEDERNGKSQSS